MLGRAGIADSIRESRCARISCSARRCRWAERVELAVAADRLERRERVLERLRPRTPRGRPGMWPTTSSQFAAGARNQSAPASARPTASAGCRRSGRPTPVGVDRAGARDDLAAVELARASAVDDAEREHHARARAADVVELDRDVDREVVVHAMTPTPSTQVLAVDPTGVTATVCSLAVALDARSTPGSSAPFSRTARSSPIGSPRCRRRRG